MLDLIPSGLEEKIVAFVKEAYLPKRRQKGRNAPFSKADLHFFTRSVRDLSESFTAGRHELPKNYFNRKEYRSAYILSFFLTNYAKTFHCLKQLELLGKIPKEGIVTLCDLGAGPGTASIAAAHFFSTFFPKVQLAITALEQNAHILNDAKKLFAQLVEGQHQFKGEEGYATPKGLPPSLKEKKFDLIIAANVINELSSEGQYSLCKNLITHHLTEQGVALFIDPALQRTTRDLMWVRDRLLENREATILAPCLHQHQCPMRATNKRDWCHFYLEWRCPELIKIFDRVTGNKHYYLKMAYFIFSRCHPERSEGSPERYAGDSSARPVIRGKPQNDNLRWRVVSSPMPSNGKTEMLLCGSSGKLLRIDQLDRDLARGEKGIRTIKRGDIVEWSGHQSRVGKGETLRHHLHFNELRKVSMSPAISGGRGERNS